MERIETQTGPTIGHPERSLPCRAAKKDITPAATRPQTKVFDSPCLGFTVSQEIVRGKVSRGTSGKEAPAKRPAAVGVPASVLAIVVLRIKAKKPYVLCE